MTIGSLQQRLLHPRAVERIVVGVGKRLQEERGKPVPQIDLAKIAELEEQPERIVAAIARLGHSAVLLSKLRDLEQPSAALVALGVRVV